MKKKFIVRFAAAIVGLSLIVLTLTIALSVFIGNNVSFKEDERLFEAAKAGTLTRFYANCGAVGEEYQPVEISAVTMGQEIKSFYPLEGISDYLVDGVVAVEDREFYTHAGVNIRRTAMATFNHLFRIGKTFGASTITQQVIKNISGDNQPTARRKLAEIFRALRIEQNHTKEEILELYLNIVPLGENIVGVGMGSVHYFGKDPSELLPEEAAVLIGLINAPTLYNPHLNPDKCKEKRDNVLSTMESEGVIDREKYEQCIAAALDVLPREGTRESLYSWFVETVIEDASRDYAELYDVSESAARLILLASGYSIYTTQNVAVQTILDEYFEDAANFPYEINNGLDFSMVISDAENADLLAIVGSVGEKRGDLIVNNATVPHTPASTLKPLALYAPLIDSGEISWATVFDDVPLEFIDGIRPYPANSPGVYNGLITVKDALALSKNTVAMRLYQLLGAEKIYDSLKNDFGFPIVRTAYNSNGVKITDLAPAPLALGQLSRGVSLRALTEAYTVFPSYGALSKGRSYIRIEDSSGNTVIENESYSMQVFARETAELMNQLLMNVTGYGTAKSITLDALVDTAGKTGTSSGNLEKLFIGYTPYISAGIRAGYNDARTGVGTLEKTHLEIWDEVMTKIHEEIILSYGDSVKSFSTAGLEYLPYCKDSGKLFSESCMLDPRDNRMEYGYFTSRSKPRELCDTHIEIYYDVETEAIAHEGCPKESLIKIALLDIPNRQFSCEVIVADAEYVYRRMDDGVPPGDSFDVPYFQNALPPDGYVGRGAKKKQFNHSCYLHD